MSLRKIIDQSLVIAQAAADTAKAYKHIVWSAQDADVNSLFVDSRSRLNTIMITREETDSIDRGVNDNRDIHSIVVLWYRSATRASDASTATEDGFQDDVEALRTAFKANRKLRDGNGEAQAIWCTPMKARRIAFVNFMGLTCNYAELVFTAEDGPFNTQSV